MSLCQDVDTGLPDPNPASKPPIGGQNGPKIGNYGFFFKSLGAILKKLYSKLFLVIVHWEPGPHASPTNHSHHTSATRKFRQCTVILTKEGGRRKGQRMSTLLMAYSIGRGYIYIYVSI